MFGCRDPAGGTQALVLTPLHGHPIPAQSLTASLGGQGRNSCLPVSVPFLLLSSTCSSIPKAVVQLGAHQLGP